MPSLLSNVTWVHQVMDVVEQALIDERVEVRSKASQVLGGLLHCAFVDKERQDTLLVSRILPLPQGRRNPLKSGGPKGAAARGEGIFFAICAS